MHYYRYPSAEISCWYKYLLFSYNIIFWLAGVAFLGAGLWAWSEKGVLSDLSKMTRLHGFDPVFLILFVGGVMFILGFAGCVGALRENICLLKFFCGTIVVIFILELALAVLAFLFQDWVKDRVETFFKNNIKAYRDDIDLQNLIDSLQKMNQCCGAQSPNDWNLNIYFNCSSASKSRERCGVPFSCCIPDPAVSYFLSPCPNLFSKAPEDKTRHNGWKLIKERSNLELRRNFLTVRIMNQWNNLPPEILDCSNIESFQTDWTTIFLEWYRVSCLSKVFMERRTRRLSIV
ncbi:tetraspanin-14 isoform X1 [Thamnophis elegans]|uniref:tetraspanin-14 isoform X1 n=1 Tax=Thamnophis elegans TaxID=35005 RepID=UPI001376F372|nr:tetraspanin-14 isoform X1 [Thamnophis elegans]